jgi:hypothetical protein
MTVRKAGALLAILMAGGTVTSARPDPPGVPSMTELSWMAGCLELRSGDRIVEEHRMGLRGGSMLGMSRTTTSKGLVEYELTLIHERAGQIVFEARPSGQPPAVFTARVAGPDSVVFEAPDHDYPQIVGYRLAGADSVVAWIDGNSRGKSRRVEFPYRRVRCAGAR